MPVGWGGLSGSGAPSSELEQEPFSEIEALEAKLEQEGEHWSHGRPWPPDGHESVAQAIDRFWSIAFDLPLESTTFSPPRKSDVMHNQQGLFADWPAPPNVAAFKRERAEYRAEFACDNRYIAERMWKDVKKTDWNKGDPVLEPTLRAGADSGNCPVLDEVLEED